MSSPTDDLRARLVAAARAEFERLIAEDSAPVRVVAAYVLAAVGMFGAPEAAWETPVPQFCHLDFSTRFANRLSWDVDGIHQRLNFPTGPSNVDLPWENVFAVGRQDAVRTVADLLAQMPEPEPEQEHVIDFGPGLRLVKGDGE